MLCDIISFGADETGTSVGLVPLVIPLDVGVVALLPLENQPPPLLVGGAVAFEPLENPELLELDEELRLPLEKLELGLEGLRLPLENEELRLPLEKEELLLLPPEEKLLAASAK